MFKHMTNIKISVDQRKCGAVVIEEEDKTPFDFF